MDYILSAVVLMRDKAWEEAPTLTEKTEKILVPKEKAKGNAVQVTLEGFDEMSRSNDYIDSSTACMSLTDI